MITPSYGLTATERVLPSFTLDWTTGLVQSTVDVTRVGVATFVGSSGLIQSASADTQRIDYSTGTAGLLVEESRTNLFLYSNDFRDTATAGETRPWVWTNVTVTSDAETSPDGTVNASKLEETATTGNHVIKQTISVTNGVTYAYSVYAKADERDTIDIRFGGSNGARFNLSTQAVTNVGSGVGSITAAANGFYRCTVIFTSAAISYAMNIYMFKGAISYAGTEGEGLFVFGAQLEAGAFPTSYIPTEASAVTRNADVATVTGTNFSDFFNAAEGTFVLDFSLIGLRSLAGQRILSVDDESTDNYIAIVSTGTNARNSLLYNGSFQATNTTPATTFVAGVEYQTSVAYKEDYSFAADNGVSGNLDTTVVLPTGLDTLRFGRASNAQGNNLLVRRLRFYKQAITLAEAAAFTN